MKITSLAIDGFGIFHNTELERLPQNLVLVLGDNEAGKSTMLGFLRGMLFGLTRKNASEPDYPPLRGGRHGGQLRVALNDGGERMIERIAGVGGERLYVSVPGGEVFDVKEMARLLDGATRELYKNIYAFSLGELQTFESLRTEQVRGAIYGAATGTALLALPRAMALLAAHKSGLFERGDGAGGQIGEALRELEGVRDRLRQTRGEIAAYDSVVQHLRQLDQELGAMTQRNARDRAGLELNKALQRAWPDWIEIQYGEAELAGQPTVENFPDNGIQSLETETAALQSLERQIARFGERRGVLGREMEGLPLVERLLEQVAAIDQLAVERSRYLDMRQTLPELEHLRQEAEDLLRRTFDNLGRDWNPERIHALNRSLFSREAIMRQQQVLDEGEKAVEKAADLASDRQATFNKAVQEEKLAEDAVAIFGDLETPAETAVMEELKNRRTQFAAVIPDLPLVEKQHQEASTRLGEILREINPRWGREEMQRFDNSVVAYQRLESFEARLNGAGVALAEAQGAAAAAETRLEEQRRKAAQAEKQLAAMPQPKVDKREKILGRIQKARTLRTALATLETATREARHGRERLADKKQDMTRLEGLYSDPVASDYPWLPLALGILTLLGGGALLALKYLPQGPQWLAALKTKFTLGEGAMTALSSMPLGAGVAGFGLILILWAAVAAHRRKVRFQAMSQEAGTHRQAITTAQESTTAAEAEQARLDAAEKAAHDEAENLSRELGAHNIVTLFELEGLDERLQSVLQVFDDYTRAQQDLEELKGELARATTAAEAARQAAAEKAAALEEGRAQWKKHLEQIGLETGLTPHAVIQVAARVETARKLADTVDDSARRLAQLRRAREEYRAAAAKIPALAVFANAADNELLAKVDSYFERERYLDERRRQRERAQATLGEKQDQVYAAQAALEQAKGVYAQARDQWLKASQEWRTWLQSNGLPENLSPAATMEIFRLVGICLEQMNRSAELGAKIEALQDEMKSFELRARAVFQALGRSEPEETRIAAAVQELARELKENQERRVQRQEKGNQTADIDQQLETLGQEAEQRRRRINWLFTSVAARDEADFRRRAEIAQKRTELARRWLTILKVTGDTEETALRGALGATTIEALRNQEQLLTQQIGAAEQEMERLRQRRAELAHRIDALQKADAVIRLRTQEEALLAEIREQAGKWARHAVALYLLREARDRFERDQQPSVIREASAYFSRMTGGRYERLMIPLGKDTIEAVAADGTRKKLEELSRGTAEQVYLAVRFGYIEHRASEHEHMPVIMDDILVNFDAGRATLAAEMILGLAESHQVFYFTCHRETVERFKKIRPQLAYYELRQGEFTLHEAEPEVVAVAMEETSDLEGSAAELSHYPIETHDEPGEMREEYFESVQEAVEFHSEPEAEPEAENGEGNAEPETPREADPPMYE